MTSIECDPLFDLQGIIYLIENKVNGMCYIGQSINSFTIRYHSQEHWWKNIQCRPLKHAIKEFGIESFQVKILEHSKTRAELDVLEPKYATEYDSYYPKGYNVKRCGSNQYVNKVPKLFGMGPARLSSPSGEVFEVDDLVAFCDKHRLNKYCIWKLVSGESPYQLGGWTLADNPNKGHPNWTECVLFDREGKEHRVPNLAQFCRENGFKYHRLRNVVIGAACQAHGLALSKAAFGKEKKRYVVTLAHKDGREVTLNHIQRECRAIGLHPRFVYDLKNGKLSSYIGWRLVKVEEHPYWS